MGMKYALPAVLLAAALVLPGPARAEEPKTVASVEDHEWRSAEQLIECHVGGHARDPPPHEPTEQAYICHRDLACRRPELLFGHTGLPTVRDTD